MQPQAIELTFYDDDDEPIQTYSRNRLPAYLLDMAIDLAKSMESLELSSSDKPAAELTAPLFDFVVELFGNKFDRETLKRQTDLGECMAVFQAVLSRANGLATGFAQGNPMRPSAKTK